MGITAFISSFEAMKLGFSGAATLGSGVRGGDEAVCWILDSSEHRGLVLVDMQDFLMVLVVGGFCGG